MRVTCPYARIFEPTRLLPGPSGLADWPRPFVLRTLHLDGATFAPGALFHVDLNLFDLSARTYFEETFEQLGAEGLGPTRSRVELRAVTGDDVEIELGPALKDISHMRVRFVTPTELKGGTVPIFPLLAARIRDRISNLSNIYSPREEFPIDFRTFANRAASIRMTRCETSAVHRQRRSSRTGQTHSLGGFVGEAEYQGNLGEFVSYFHAATYAGVGRQTVWGNGQIEIDY